MRMLFQIQCLSVLSAYSYTLVNIEPRGPPFSYKFKCCLIHLINTLSDWISFNVREDLATSFVVDPDIAWPWPFQSQHLARRAIPLCLLFVFLMCLQIPSMFPSPDLDLKPTRNTEVDPPAYFMIYSHFKQVAESPILWKWFQIISFSLSTLSTWNLGDYICAVFGV